MKKRTNERILQSRDVSSKVEGMAKEPELPPMTGPRTGMEFVQSPGQWLERNATAAELETFKASVQARLDRIALTGWRTLPNGMKIKGDSILATCGKCGFWAWVSPGQETSTCLYCNLRNLKDGGMMRAATKKEEAAWFKKAAEREAKFKADAPKRAAQIKAANLARRAVGKD